MAGSLSTATANAVLDSLIYTPTVYLALCDGNPGDAGDLAGNEIAASYDYARITAPFATPANARAIASDGEAAFAQANGGDFGTITYLAIVTAAVEGVDDMIAYGPLTVSKLIENGDQLVFASGNITVQFAAGT